MAESIHGVRIEVRGLVQGVGFRPWVHSLATRAGLHGKVWNHAAGVTIEAFGTRRSLDALLAAIRQPTLPGARVDETTSESIPLQRLEGFTISTSVAASERHPSIPPDLTVCEACLGEVADPADRRHAYPFTTCSHCGPRYTITHDVPYDRPQTTMAGFAMCADCRREYGDPTDRRFHAQPIACPRCGPHLRLLSGDGRRLDGAPLAVAGDLLCAGRIVAVKGLGGFHLAVDATDGAAVGRLRARKQRDAKPFAVMVRDLDAARRVAELSAAEIELLSSVARPIVLVSRRDDGPLVDALAPGNPLVGVLLPYTPLHVLLLDAVDRPLVMTSANRSDEPMAIADDDALSRLSRIADAFLLHDREIANRCDDSVARIIGGKPTVLRRSRGYVPASRRLSRPVTSPVLACGAHLKNVACILEGNSAWLGPHVGDLETDEACRAFEQSIERFQRFVGVTPEIVAHDMHPDYHSTRWAMERRDCVRVAVQHHHAHVASLMAEHGLEGPVIALAWDGTGYGLDGTAWGGELLVADFARFERLATFRPLRLAGGDQAIHQVWRSALALLDDAFAGEPPVDELALFRQLDTPSIAAVRRMIVTQTNAPLAHGVGRYFDAFGAIGLGVATARFEGEVAMAWGFAVDSALSPPYPFEWTVSAPVQLDLRPTLRAMVGDLLDGRDVATMAGRFHSTLVAIGGVMVEHAVKQVGELPVLLTGGCFQNEALVSGLLHELSPRHQVFTHGDVPPNDGGVALGQALVAARR